MIEGYLKTRTGYEKQTGQGLLVLDMTSGQGIYRLTLNERNILFRSSGSREVNSQCVMQAERRLLSTTATQHNERQ